MPEKVNVFIEYLAELYGSDPYWEKGLVLAKPAAARPLPEVAAAEAKPELRAVATKASRAAAAVR
jgi:hypothetical protein